MTQQKKKK